MAKEESMEVEGVVAEDLSKGKFRVRCDNELEVIAHLSGKMRMHNIRIVPGDKVKLDVSPYDLTKGRITFRVRQ